MGEEEGAAPIPASQILGFLGLALAVFGITPVPSDLRLSCLCGASVCLPACFFLQEDWPRPIRWLLGIGVDLFFGYVAWSSLQSH